MSRELEHEMAAPGIIQHEAMQLQRGRRSLGQGHHGPNVGWKAQLLGAGAWLWRSAVQQPNQHVEHMPFHVILLGEKGDHNRDTRIGAE